MGYQDDHRVIIRLNLDELEQMKAEINFNHIKTLRENQAKIIADEQLYYDDNFNEKAKRHYYANIGLYNSDPGHLFDAIHNLLTKTHQHKLPYYISKDQFLYTWVDLQPDGSITSIYSGNRQDPYKIIVEDNETIQKRYHLFKQLLDEENSNSQNYFHKIDQITVANKFNAEHVVPQSWYQGKEPMKGDLHHLFACQPFCNAKRSNYPYYDFKHYTPESSTEIIRNFCGVSYLERFEPEYGKGPVARAMLYFLVRYPRVISRRFRRKINLNLLMRWHAQFPATIYEQHRNNAIFLIQGNRNPFIDYPELTNLMQFYL